MSNISNNAFYLYIGQWFWALSPSDFTDLIANGFALTSNGGFSHSNVTSSRWVRPVLSLKSGTTISGGSGTATDPFIVLS